MVHGLRIDAVVLLLSRAEITRQSDVTVDAYSCVISLPNETSHNFGRVLGSNEGTTVNDTRQSVFAHKLTSGSLDASVSL
jgi:hypothetical protein